jgi:hypothetical protein
MTTRQLVRLAMVLFACVAIWLGLALTRHFRDAREARFTLGMTDVASVDTIVMSRSPDTLVFARAADGAWTVNGYAAASDAVGALLMGLGDTALVSELVAEKSSSHARLGITADSGRRLRVLAHGRAVLDLTIGRSSDAKREDVFVRRTGAERVYELHGALASVLRLTGDDWRDKRVVSVYPSSVAMIEINRGTAAYKLRRVPTGWTFEPGGPADSTAVAALLDIYRNLFASGFATRAQSDSLDFKHVRGHVRFAALNGKQLLDLLADSTKSDVWVRAASGGPVFRMEPVAWPLIVPAEVALRPHRR